MSSIRLSASSALAALASCSATMTEPDDPWAAEFEPPRVLDTGRVHLEPLRAEHAASDHAALMSSVEHLRRTLGWGGWPRDGFTVGQNRSDLEAHERQFESRSAYAYTVETPDRARCVGCVYLDPLRDEDWHGAGPRDPRDVLLESWVVETELGTGLDAHLLTSVLAWLDGAWPFSTVYVPLRAENTRGTAIARELGLVETTDVKRRDTIAWRRPR